LIPEGVEAVAMEGTAEREDISRPWRAPEHSGLFESFSDDRFAAGFNDSGTDDRFLTHLGSELTGGFKGGDVRSGGLI